MVLPLLACGNDSFVIGIEKETRTISDLVDLGFKEEEQRLPINYEITQTFDVFRFFNSEGNRFNFSWHLSKASC